jgi:hypothetical protein
MPSLYLEVQDEEEAKLLLKAISNLRQRHAGRKHARPHAAHNHERKADKLGRMYHRLRKGADTTWENFNYRP